DAGILGGGIGSDLAATSAGLAPEEAALSNGTIGTAASGIPTSSGGLTSYLSNLLGGHTAVSGGGIAGRGVGGYLGPIGQALSISSGLYGMEQSKRLQALAQQQAATQSPFDPYRAQYAQKLQALEADPNSITALPGYQAGLEAVKRSMASQGFNGSGNMMAALQKYGGDFYNNALNQYATLAGAGAAPGAGAGLAVQGSALGTQLMGSSLASLGYGVAGR
ncbi:MAG: hypothetical protein ACREQ5_13930, partial [Candidatus Dormibacteria bacterium]